MNKPSLAAIPLAVDPASRRHHGPLANTLIRQMAARCMPLILLLFGCHFPGGRAACTP